MTQLRRCRATLEDKLAYWVAHRLNVLFRCGPGVGIASEMKAAFDKSGLRWQELYAFTGEIKQTGSDNSVETVFVHDIDRVPKKLLRAFLVTLGKRSRAVMFWATVTVMDKDDFDLESADPLYAEGFGIVVDMPTQPLQSR